MILLPGSVHTAAGRGAEPARRRAAAPLPAHARAPSQRASSHLKGGFPRHRDGSALQGGLGRDTPPAC
eukprot:7225033-Prymnesium_polylepis.1